MPKAIFPVLIVSPALPRTAMSELQFILNTIAHGAFGEQIDFSIVITEHSQQTVLEIEIETGLSSKDSNFNEVSISLAETALQLIARLAQNLGIPTRQRGLPCRPMLRAGGLTSHHAKQKLAKLFATSGSADHIELACANSSHSIKLGMGVPLGSNSVLLEHLCSTIVRYRRTPQGYIVRVKSGQQLMSIAIPSDVAVTDIFDGSAIVVTPVVGLIPRRLLRARPCQLSLLRDS